MTVPALALLESGKYIRMCQVSWGKLGLIDGRVELDLDVVESAAQWGIDGSVTGKHGSDAGPEKAVIEAGEESSGPWQLKGK